MRLSQLPTDFVAWVGGLVVWWLGAAAISPLKAPRPQIQIQTFWGHDFDW